MKIMKIIEKNIKNICKIDFVIQGNMIYTNVAYYIGKDKKKQYRNTISFDEGKDLVKRIENDVKLRPFFVARGIVGFIVNGAIVTQNKFNEELKKLHEEESKKESEKESTKKPANRELKKILIDPEADKSPKYATVFYKGEEPKNMSKEQLKKEILKYCKEKNIKDSEILFKKKIIKRKKKIIKGKSEKSPNKKYTAKEEKSSRKKIVKGITIGTGMAVASLAVILGGYKLSHSSKEGSINFAVIDKQTVSFNDQPQDNIEQFIKEALAKQEQNRKEIEQEISKEKEETQENIAEQEKQNETVKVPTNKQNTNTNGSQQNSKTPGSLTTPEDSQTVNDTLNLDAQDSIPNTSNNNSLPNNFNQQIEQDIEEGNKKLAEDLNNWGITTNQPNQETTNKMPGIEDTGIEPVKPDDVTEVVEVQNSYERQAQQIIDDMANHSYETEETSTRLNR